jgi:hypothetical protein
MSIADVERSPDIEVPDTVDQGLDPDPKEPRIHETTRVRTWSRGSGP